MLPRHAVGLMDMLDVRASAGRATWPAAVLALLMVSSGCGSSPASMCDDRDGDSYGESCGTGPDCAPDDPNHWADCGRCIDADHDGRGGACDRGTDCDDASDACFIGCEMFYADVDGDTFGDASSMVRACTMPSGFVRIPGDCDADDAAHFNDCMSCVDADGDGYGIGCNAGFDCDDDPTTGSGCFTQCTPWYVDTDGDGVGASVAPRLACTAPAGHAATAGDCAADDADHWSDCGLCIDADGDDHGAACDLGLDCDDSVATGASCTSTCIELYWDGDADGRGDPAVNLGLRCTAYTGAVANTEDCNPGSGSHWSDCGECVDLDGDAYGAGCDLGPDCDDDPTTGSACTSSCASFYPDADADGHGDTASGVSRCVAPSGYFADGTDCDPTSAAHWGDCGVCADADEDDYGTSCDLGSDCDDLDGDNWSACATCVDLDVDASFVGCDAYVTRVGPDCDDAEPTTHPGAPELPDDGVANGCTGTDVHASAGAGTYVADGHPNCQNSVRGTRTQPNCSLAAALGFPFPENEANVYVADGSYSIPQLSVSRSIFGGYDASDWGRDFGVTQLFATSAVALVLVDGGRDVVLQGLTLSGANAAVPEVVRVATTSARGVWLIDDVVATSGTTSAYAIRLVRGTRATVIRTHVLTGQASLSSSMFRLEGGSLRLLDSLLLGEDVSSAYNTGVEVTDGSELVAFRNSFSIGGGVGSVVVSVSSQSRAVLGDSTLENGAASQDGAIAYCAGACMLVNNRIWAQTATQGAALRGVLTLVDNSVLLVGAVGSPGALVEPFGNSVVLVNNIFDTSAVAGSTPLRTFAPDGAPFSLIHNLLHGPSDCVLNTDTDCFTVAQIATGAAGSPGAVGNFDAAPGFADGELHLAPGSACIDAGADPSSYVTWPFDFEGDARPRDGDGMNGAQWDVGADEL